MKDTSLFLYGKMCFFWYGEADFAAIYRVPAPW